MKRFALVCLLLAMLLTLTACLPATGDTPPEEQHLTADVPETEVWHRRADTWNGTVAGQTLSPDFERISGGADKGMTVGQELLLLDFMDCWNKVQPEYNITIEGDEPVEEPPPSRDY